MPVEEESEKLTVEKIMENEILEKLKKGWYDAHDKNTGGTRDVHFFSEPKPADASGRESGRGRVALS